MNIEEFIDEIDTISIKPEVTSEIEATYGMELPNLIKKILSFDSNGYFFGDNKRLLSFVEINTADEDLHVEFISMKIIPLFDTGDNDFIVYSSEDEKWELFNIIDKCAFYKSPELKELLLM